LLGEQDRIDLPILVEDSSVVEHDEVSPVRRIYKQRVTEKLKVLGVPNIAVIASRECSNAKNISYKAVENSLKRIPETGVRDVLLVEGNPHDAETFIAVGTPK
jgi:hypothetical protein